MINYYTNTLDLFIIFPFIKNKLIELSALMYGINIPYYFIFNNVIILYEKTYLLTRNDCVVGGLLIKAINFSLCCSSWTPGNGNTLLISRGISHSCILH